MAETILTICSPDRTWRVNLSPRGAVMGRHPGCDVVIDSREVSRKHAELFLTPAQQWALKDLGSSNGTFVNGKRVETCILTAEDVVEIGPVTLLLGKGPGQRAVTAPAPQGPKIIVEDFGTEVFYDKPRIEECGTPPYPTRLAHVEKRLAELTDPGTVYPEICRALAQGPHTAAAVFRVPPKDQPLPQTPKVVAYHFGSSGEDTLAPISDRWHPSHQDFRVSHRLLEAVRADGWPRMTKSIFSCDTQVTISLIDEYSPRALLCAPVSLGQEAVDLLYADVPIDEHLTHGPEEMFAFVQAVVHRAASVLTTLTSAEGR